MKRPTLGVCLFSAFSLLALAGCAGAGASPSMPASSTSPSGPARAISVVASTDVYGDIATTIGGDTVSVTSIISDPDKDPHSYEADARTRLVLSKADIVIENGGGYDDFVDTMLKASGAHPTVINVSDLSGHDQHPSNGQFNERVWYDIPTVVKLTDALQTALETADPNARTGLAERADRFRSALGGLERSEAAIKSAHGGEGVAITEPVPLYLLTAAGLKNLTPPAFSEAVEEDTDVAPAVLSQTLNLFDTKQVRLLAYNEQTTGAQTEAVLTAAQKNGIPVVPVTETLPTGKTYLTWMGGNLQAVATALGS